MLKRIFNSPFIYPIAIILTGLIAWHRTLDFWFLKGFETSWLMGSTPHTLVNLIKSHSFLYYLDWKIFGWNPSGWYLTSLVLHIVAALTLFRLVEILTKNRQLSFISSLIFVANTAYNDVLTWGSFNSYYPLLLIFMSLALIKFIDYRKNGSSWNLLLSMFFSFLAFFTRETGLVIVAIITLYDFINTKDAFSKKVLYKIVIRQFPFYLSVFAFLMIRSWYGGIPGDFADSNVKMRVKLIADGLYFVYFKSILLTIGKLISPQAVPYPILNDVRESLKTFVNANFLNKYFFPFIGWVTISLLSYALYLLRKKKKDICLPLLFTGWVACFITFVAMAIPYTEEFLSRDYKFITMRYGYFAFAGTSVLLAYFLIFLSKKLQKKAAKIGTHKILATAVTFYLGVQLYHLHKIQSEAYLSTYSEPKRFNSQFSKEFPSLPDGVVFYIYPHASGLNDFLYEWSFVKDKQYPNLADEPYRIESQIAAVLKKVKEGKLDLSSVIFLDYNSNEGIINRTKEARTVLAKQGTYFLEPAESDRSTYIAKTDGVPFVETPYLAEINMSSSFGIFKQGSRPDSKKFRALVDYSIDRARYLKTAKVNTANTLSQRPGEPFLHVLPENLIDGNVGERSSWIVDAVPAWIKVDLGRELNVAALAWGSQPGVGRTPSTYTYSASLDGINWEKVLEISNNKKDSRLDILDGPIRARYIKMDLHTTQTGNFALLDEFEVITDGARAVLNLYISRDQLLKDFLDTFSFMASYDDFAYAKKAGLDTFWAKLRWNTNKDSPKQNSQELYFRFKVQLQPQEVRVKIPEGEIFAASGQMFDKYLTEISLEFGELPLNIDVFLIKLVPQLSL